MKKIVQLIYALKLVCYVKNFIVYFQLAVSYDFINRVFYFLYLLKFLDSYKDFI